MTALAILIPVALGLGGLGLVAFFWAMRRDQLEDLDGAAQRVLLDDEDEFTPGSSGQAEPDRHAPGS